MKRGASKSIDELLNAVFELVDEELPIFTEALRQSFDEIDPIFIRKNYPRLFLHCAGTVPGWLAQVVFANADAESDGSAKLLSLWKGVTYNKPIESNILDHAKDEAGHSRLFIRLARLTFPHLVSEEFASNKMSSLTVVGRDELRKDDLPIPEDDLLDHLIQMNIGEIRTRVHVRMFAPVIAAFAPDESRDAVEEILSRLLMDEVRHIGYTARLVERWAEGSNRTRVLNLYRRRLADFNSITIEQTTPVIEKYAAGLFPDLLEI